MQKVVLITGGKGETAQAIAKRFSRHLTPSSKILDVTNPMSVKAYMEIHKPYVLVNCAGFIKPEGVADSDIQEWEKQIAVNLMGVYYCTKFAMMNGARRIVNIASAGGFKGRKDWSAYCAAKAGVISFTESLTEEGVEAYCISPHRIDTKMRHSLFPDENKKTLMNPNDLAVVVEDAVNGKYPWGTHLDVSVSGTQIIT